MQWLSVLGGASFSSCGIYHWSDAVTVRDVELCAFSHAFWNSCFRHVYCCAVEYESIGLNQDERTVGASEAVKFCDCHDVMV